MPDHDPRDEGPLDPPSEDRSTSEDPDTRGDRVPRARTAVRIALSLVFLLLTRVAGAVFVAVVAFELLYTLVTERPPTAEVRRFANRVLSYLVEIARYLTYENDTPPFPFSELPAELEYIRKDGAAA